MVAGTGERGVTAKVLHDTGVWKTGVGCKASFLILLKLKQLQQLNQ